MIYPHNNKFIRWVFHHYIINLVKRNFKQVKFNDVVIESGKSVLLLANHFSWWDGFMLYYINHVVVKKRFHIMVLEETVKNVGFIKYMGAFSVNKNSREILTSLDYAAQLLADPGNLVLIFPQGKLYSNFTGEIVFEKGLNRIMQKAGNSFQTIFAATFIENLQHKKPVATVYLEQGKQIDGATLLTDVRKAYQLHYNSSKLVQTEIVI